MNGDTGAGVGSISRFKEAETATHQPSASSMGQSGHSAQMHAANFSATQRRANVSLKEVTI